MNILEFCYEPPLDEVFGDRRSWFNWYVDLAAIYAIPIGEVSRLLGRTEAEILKSFQKFTKRTYWPLLPATEAWILSGRKSGKSRIVSVVIAYEMLVRLDWQNRLTPGERAVFPCVAVDRLQAQIIFSFVRGILYSSKMFKAMIISETKEEIELDNGATLRVMVADKASVRGPLYIGLAADETAFWKTGDGFANPDHEVFQAFEPGIIDGGLIISISSVAGEMGLLYETYKEHFGKDGDQVLVWQSDTMAMNPCYSQSKIDRMMAKDSTVAMAEYGSIFRTDMSGLYNSMALEDCRVPGSMEMPYQTGNSYRAFVDMSGGKKDSHSLAIAHRGADGKVIIDITREVIPSPRVKPSDVCVDFAKIIKGYGLSKAVGDAYGAQWVVEGFAKEGITLEKSEKNSSEIYLYCIGPFSNRQVALPDDNRLLAQLKALMRRIVPGGKDKVLSGKTDRSHSDLSNAVCGSIFLVGCQAGDSIGFEMASKNESDDDDEGPSDGLPTTIGGALRHYARQGI